MKAKKKKEIIWARSNVPISTFLERLKKICTEEFDKAKNSQTIQYYGHVSNTSFNIRNVKYSEYSSGPSIQGNLVESSNSETMIEIDVDSKAQNRYANTILTVTILVIAFMATLASIGNQADTRLSIILFAVLSIFAICYVLILKFVLKNSKKKEIKHFLNATESYLA